MRIKSIHMILLTVIVSHCYGDTSLFYRVKSSTNSQILTFQEKGCMVWSNSITNATTRLEVAPSLSGPWRALTSTYPVINAQTACAQFLHPPTNTAEWAIGHILVGFVGGVEVQEQRDIVASYGVTGTVSHFATFWKVYVTPQHELEWVAIFESNPRVKYAEPDYICYISK